MGTSPATRQSFSSVHSSNFIADLLVYHQDRTSPQSQQRSSATAFAATRGSGSCRRRTTELVVRLIVWLVAQCLSPSRISLLIYLSPTSTGPRRSQRRLPPDCEATRYASPLLFQAGDGVWAAKARGEASVPGNEREAGPPADRAAPRSRSLRLPTPLLVQKIKILKMDEDGDPSQPPSDCGEGDTSASCAVRTASRRPRGRPRRDSQNSRGNATSSLGARRS